MSLPSQQVGLGLLFCPLNSNIVVRTACCSVGLVLPVYSTFKAIENKDPNEQHRWLLYWAAYGSFSVAELFAEKVLSWIPLYYHVKFVFLLWLQLPTINGARQLYASYLRPFLLKHQARLDLIVDFVYGEMGKFISAHQAELLFARTLATKVLVAANQIIRDIIHPVERESKRTEGPKRQVQDSESEVED
ncbi:TB2/DP1/HVA22-related protein [Sesbania bispinosa]|nr:TB2/DP1/HVA22-related protein [Sesbania bispinosa]